jgi:osmoprotectant transport system ATP-binding protein
VVLSAPATDFVASFVGRDRGYRGLSFRHGDGVSLHPITTASEQDAASIRLDQGQWLLVVSAEGRPRGWMDVTGLEALKSGASIADSTSAGGSLYPPSGDLRQALDAAISSPSGVGVAVDANGAVLGGIDATEVVALLADQRRAEDRERGRQYFEKP